MEIKSKLNSICPYFTMFPIDFPLRCIDEFENGKPNGILDPFCGRGTTNFAARSNGICTIGLDVSPVATAISRSKMVGPKPCDIVNTAKKIISDDDGSAEIPVGIFWEKMYDPHVLDQLCILRDSLLTDCSSAERIALNGLILGALHGPIGVNKQSYFSNQCPRTYSPKPHYAVKFWEKNGKMAPKADVIKIIEDRANRYYGDILPTVGNKIIQDNSVSATPFKKIKKALLEHNHIIDLVITSPPYLGMSTYVQDQWIRNWFVGGPSEISYQNGDQISHSVTQFSKELRKVWENCSSIMDAGSTMSIRFGAINSRTVDPAAVICESLESTEWEMQKISSAGIPSESKRQANTFSKTNLSHIEEIDVVAKLN